MRFIFQVLVCLALFTFTVEQMKFYIKSNTTTSLLEEDSAEDGNETFDYSPKLFLSFSNVLIPSYDITPSPHILKEHNEKLPESITQNKSLAPPEQVL